MKGISYWEKHEIIGLKLFHSVHGPQLRSIVSMYECLESFCHYGLSASLFSGTPKSLAEDIRELGIQHIYQHKHHNIELFTFHCNEYPRELLHIDYPPSILYVKGKLSNESTIGIVGTRKPTIYGKRVAEHFAEILSLNGFCIASGLAPGIDTIVHDTVVKHKGHTYAVIASGHEQISPKYAYDLSSQIIDMNGAIISEYSMNTKAKPPFFPRRNRIISGLSSSILIVESGKKGGSMITAQFAFDQNREVFVIPGSIYSPMSEGNHLLLSKDKGKIVTSPEEIMNYLNIEKRSPLRRLECSVEEHAILQVMRNEPIHIDELVYQSNISRSIVMSCLLNLECRSIIKQMSGMNYISLYHESTLSKKT